MAGARGDDDLTAVLANDLLRDRQAEAGPARAFGRGEDLKDRGDIVFLDADAIVADGDSRGRRLSGSHSVLTTTWAFVGTLTGVDRVGDDIQDGPVDALGVDRDLGHVRRRDASSASHPVRRRETA